MSVIGTAMGYLDLDISGLKKGLSTALTELSSFKGAATKIGGAAVSGIETAFKGASSSLLNVSSGVVSGFSTMAKGVVTGTAAAAAGLGTLAVASAQTGMSFETAMSQVAATMGKTVDEIPELTAVAKEMGSTTKFTATEAAEALNYLALAGYDSATSVEVLPTVLNLASAGAMDLASASDMVTDAMSALGKDSSYAETMVDQMAKTASTTNTSVSQLGEAILQLGATGKTVKGGTVELNTALGILANNGIKGAEGGTHLRNVLLSLQAPTDQAKDALNTLGVSVFDSSGEMRSLNDVLGDLNSAMSDMTTEEKQNIISTIFNKTDLASVNALLANTGDTWEELAAAIEDSGGAAADMAETQLDNLQGRITIMKSALDGLKLSFYDTFSNTAKGAVETLTGYITRLTTALDETGFEGFIEEVGNIFGEVAVKIAEAAPAAISMATSLVSSILSNFTSQLPQFLSAGEELILSLVDGFTTIFPQVVDIAVQIVTWLVESLSNNSGELITAAQEMFDAYLNGLNEVIPTIAEAAPSIISDLLTALAVEIPQLIQTSVNIINTLIYGISSNASKIGTTGGTVLLSFVQGVLSILSNLLPAAVNIITYLAAYIATNAGPIISSAGTVLYQFIQGIMSALPTLIISAVSIIVQLAQYLIDNMPVILSTGAQMLIELCNGIIQQIPTLVETAVVLLGEFIGYIITHLPDILATGLEMAGQLILGIGDGIISGIGKLFGIGKDSAEAVSDGFNTSSGQFTIDGQEAANSFASGLSNTDSVTASAFKLNSAVSSTLSSPDWSSTGFDLGIDVASGIGASSSTLQNKAKGAVNSISNPITQYNWNSIGYGVTTSLGGGINTGATGVTNSTKTLLNKSVSAINQSKTSFQTAGKSSGDAVATGISSSKSSVENSAQSLATTVSSTLNKSKTNNKTAGMSAGQSYAAGISSAKSSVESSAKALSSSVYNTWKNNQSNFKSIGNSSAGAIASGMSEKSSTISTIATSESKSVYNAFAQTSWSSLGYNISYGIATGITNGKSSVINAAVNTSIAAYYKAKSYLGIRSPSRKFAWLGNMSMEGLANGISDRAKTVIKTIGDVTASMVENVRGNLQEMGDTEFVDTLYDTAKLMSIDKSTLYSNKQRVTQNQQPYYSQSQLGGNTYNFYSPEAVTPYKAAKLMKQTSKQLALGIG